MSYEFEQSLVYRLHRASQLADRLFEDQSDGTLPTPRQFVVLAGIIANSGASQSEIVKSTGIDRSTLADIVRRLVECQLVKRTRNECDARAYELQVTETGQAAHDAAVHAAQKVDELLFQCQCQTSRESLVAALDAMSTLQVLAIDKPRSR